MQGVLCVFGPLSVGKTSLAFSFAVALRQKFVCISLGGVMRLISEVIVEHIYVGSMPGKPYGWIEA